MRQNQDVKYLDLKIDLKVIVPIYIYIYIYIYIAMCKIIKTAQNFKESHSR